MRKIQLIETEKTMAECACQEDRKVEKNTHKIEMALYNIVLEIEVVGLLALVAHNYSNVLNHHNNGSPLIQY